MNANAEAEFGSGITGATIREISPPQGEDINEKNDWNPQDFAREQIRTLVRLVFFSGEARPIKQVVFSAAELGLNVASVCDQVARLLAVETRGQVALVDGEKKSGAAGDSRACFRPASTIRARSSQMMTNLWRVPRTALSEGGHEAGTALHWVACLAQLRNEFEYLVIHGPVAGGSSEAALLGQLTDGIILVLGAHSTRRATVKNIKRTLEAAESRILGTVLSERTFPIPERIYRRL
ncbi:MAG: hypothetical protein WB919_22835 [Candidatus Sulfotelmatobacter sp.]